MRVAYGALGALLMVGALAGGLFLGRTLGRRTEVMVFHPAEVRPDVSGFPARGDEHGAVICVEYFDLLCGPCETAHASIDSLYGSFPKGVAFYAKPRPVGRKIASVLGARAMLAAKAQNVAPSSSPHTSQSTLQPPRVNATTDTTTAVVKRFIMDTSTSLAGKWGHLNVSLFPTAVAQPKRHKNDVQAKNNSRKGLELALRSSPKT